MDIDPHLLILRQAAAGTLPASIDSESPVSVQAVRDLIASGYMEAIDTSSFDGPAFLNPSITISGREYLRVLEELARAASLTGKTCKHLPAVFKWVFSIVAALLVAFLTKRFVG
ncbi:MAG: hypothetical protein ACOY6E_00800 [Pseudomonadota bacterium]